MPLISVVIPHSGGGKELIAGCLRSLKQSRGPAYEVIVVENGSADLKLDWLNALIPGAQYLHFETGIGFAAACNRGVEAASGDLIFLLNNDAEVGTEALQLLAAEFASRSDLGAIQPKILSLRHPGQFDYSSACGGFMDRFGFPFARGRVFDAVEQDQGQYEAPMDVFWGAGTALMLRRSLYMELGGLAEFFFAHMEEIDLLWRFQLSGWRVAVLPSAVVKHLGAATIKSGSFRKQYLNHRNNLAMLLRNYSAVSLLRYMPVRILFDIILLTTSLFSLKLVRLRAVCLAHIWLWIKLPFLLQGRRTVQYGRKVSDAVLLKRLYPRSVVWDYFIRRRRTWRQLMELTAG